MSKIKVGCCGFPKGMKEYFTKFKVVEVQKTFYQLPSPQTTEKWYKNAPENFEFCIKAFQGITHPATSPTYKRLKKTLDKPENYGFFKQTEEVLRAWEGTEKICSILHAKYVLFQCPSSFKPTEENLDNMISFFKRMQSKSYTFVWEPRGKAWTQEIIAEVCKKCNLIHCVDPFAQQPVTQDIAYFRLHGKPPGNKMYYYSYKEEDLRRLLDWCNMFKETYCFFNNIEMFNDAIRFKNIIVKEE